MITTGVTNSKSAADQRYYSENYANYEAQTPQNKLNFYVDLVEKWVPKSAKIFELGVAMGHFFSVITQKYEGAGCDINSYGVDLTRKKCPKSNILLGSYEQIKPDLNIGAVVSWDVLEHLPDIDAGLAHIYQNLPAGGRLIAVVPIYDGALGWLVRRLDNDPTHVTKIGRGDWQRKLTQNGFKIKEFGGILRKLVGQKYIHLTQPQALLRHACSAIYFVAEK